MTRVNGVRLLLVAAVALLLLTCTVAAWALPHARPFAPASGSSTSAATVDDHCGWIIGPAHDYCPLALSRPAKTPLSTEQATFKPSGSGGGTGLLLFSTLAIAAAIGLVSTAGRRL
ncbi:hypothetical protein ACFWBF_30275 [Streptomyces sp. NPDC060028]|uniref:hypothetical protein n=1 Tax=Streptomyces sp. NPDC060028 TaxID=3347041 RepID=UPI0036C46E2F